ncbi:MAG: DUF192 domain-containing protein [Anaerolineae bacterium]|nr:DUF192 domain-containing protein [Anaerolineae bacterium]
MRVIRRASTGEVVLARARWCQGFWCHLRGLMFRRHLPDDEGLLFVYRRASVGSTTIHMFFVFFPIAAVWLDDEGRVVSTALARPWRPYYAPDRPARYLIEARPALLDRVAVGDQLTFSEQAQAGKFV